MLKSNIPRLLAFLLFCLFLNSSCAVLKLYEIPPGTKKVSATGSPKALELINELEKRPAAKIEKSKDDEKRLVRRDLQDLIDEEWSEGWEYIKELDIKLFATDKEGTDGLLVHEDRSACFDTGIPTLPAVPSPHIEAGPKLCFIHLSDIQLHDERVYMFSEDLTNLFDQFVESFKHAPDMAFYDYSYYLALIGTMRVLCDKLPEEQRPRPSFMIHTGDAIDMGVVSELYEMIYITNKLRIPWYNVLGNHDYQVYGNISSKDVGVIKPHMGFLTINSRYNFISMHGKGFDVDRLVYFSPDNAPDDDTLLTGSVYNGFDVRGDSFAEEGRLRERRNRPCRNCPGYYYFEALQPKDGEPGILCIVLDTTTRDFRFAKGTVYRHNEVEGPPDEEKRFEQIDWMKGILEKYHQKGNQKENWMTLVFGHHQLEEGFFDDSDEELLELFNEPRYNVIAYFCGHTHKHEVKYHENPTNPEVFGFWEIVADSILEYPKRGSLVTFRYTEDGVWEMVLQSFWPYFLEKLDTNTPTLLRNARRCFYASKEDNKSKQLKAYEKLDLKHHDVVLKFVYPKTK